MSAAPTLIRLDEEGRFEPWRVVWTLLWADAVEKIDILLLEIRHLQVSLIYSLEVGELLQALHFEERFIWGEILPAEGGDPVDWSKLLLRQRVSLAQLGELAAAFVPAFRKEHDQFHRRAEDGLREPLSWPEGLPDLSREELLDDLTRAVLKKWLGAEWGVDARRSLYLLDALQRLKRNLVFYKLHLCWWGCWASPPGGGPGPAGGGMGDEQAAHVLCVRAAVLEKTRQAVVRLGDLQAQFEQTLELAAQADRRPLASRRRRQGVYSSFLATRVVDLRVEVDTLLDRLELEDPQGARRSPVVAAHRWQHRPASEAPFLADDVGRLLGPDSPPAVAIDHVNSSYWMLDRPDLQAVLAHEAAHAVLRRRLDVRSSTALAQAGGGAFARLMRGLAHCMELYELDPYGADRNPYRLPPFDLGEIASDLLAAAAYGHAYLFALTQELAGHGCAALLALPNEQINLNLAPDLWRLRHAAEPVHLEWYLRLRVVAAFVAAIEEGPERSRLGRALVDGVVGVTERLHGYLGALYSGDNLRWPAYWEELTRRMVELVTRSRVIGLVREWRRERHQLLDDGRSGRRPVRRGARSARPLDPAVTDFLVRGVVERKRTATGRALRRDLELRPEPGGDAEAFVRFNRLYLGLTGGEEAPLFQRVENIPWESAVLRALDFLDAAGEARVRGPVGTLSRDFHPGREAYQIALEFAAWQGKTAADRLLLATRMVGEALAATAEPVRRSPTLGAALTAWHGCPPDGLHVLGEEEFGPVVETLDRLRKGHETTSALGRREAERRIQAECDRIAREHHASLLQTLHLRDRYRGPRSRSYLIHQLYGRKLEELSGILRTHDLAADPGLAALKGYLEISAPGRREASEGALLGAIARGAGRERGHDFRIDEIVFFGIAAWASDPRRPSHGEPGCEWVLGRFDKVLLREEDPARRGSLPRMAPADATRLVPFLEQRELGLRLALGRGAVVERGRMLALCSVILAQRDARLEFLSRLLAREGPTLLEGRLPGPVLGPLDYAYLAEGSGDVILVFREDGPVDGARIARRLRDILHVSTELFGDFLVDRTETMLFPIALEAVACEDERCPQIGLSQEVRMRSVRRRDPLLQRFLEQLRDNLRDLGFPEGRPRTRVVPGLSEFVIDYDPEDARRLLRAPDGEPDEGGAEARLMRALYRPLRGTDLIESVDTRLLFGTDVIDLGTGVRRRAW